MKRIKGPTAPFEELSLRRIETALEHISDLRLMEAFEELTELKREFRVKLAQRNRLETESLK